MLPRVRTNAYSLSVNSRAILPWIPIAAAHPGMPQHLQAAFLELEATRAEQQRNLDMQRAHKNQVETAKVSFSIS